METTKKFSKSQLEQMLHTLDQGQLGSVLRAKGIRQAEDGSWLQFDYVPEEWELRPSSPDYTGRLCVIGSGLKENGLKELFGV